MARAWLVAALALACGCAAEYVPVDEMETDDFLAGPKKRKQEFLERVQEEKQAAFSAMRVRQAKLEGCTLKGTMPCGLGRVFIFKQVRANELLFGGQSYCCPEDADVEPDLDLGTSLNQAKVKTRRIWANCAVALQCAPLHERPVSPLCSTATNTLTGRVSPFCRFAHTHV